MKKKNTFIAVILIFIIVFMLISPQNSILACFKGINVWSSTLLPALFPFFFITKLLAETGGIEKLGSLLAPITQKLYNAPGISGYVWAMGIISGYPVSAKLTSDLYKNNVISKGQACRITAFTSTSGPLFIVGSVGVGMFFNQKIGIIMLLSHILGATLNGLIYRNYMTNETFVPAINIEHKSDDNILENCMLSAIKSVLIVGGYVCFFFMIITIINNFGLFTPINWALSKILPLSYSTISSITNGIVEVTRGCLDLSTLGLKPTVLCVIATALISFGGFSIFLQALTFLKSFGISTAFYFVIKITQTLLSSVIAFIFCLILL